MEIGVDHPGTLLADIPGWSCHRSLINLGAVDLESHQPSVSRRFYPKASKAAAYGGVDLEDGTTGKSDFVGEGYARVSQLDFLANLYALRFHQALLE